MPYRYTENDLKLGDSASSSAICAFAKDKIWKYNIQTKNLEITNNKERRINRMQQPVVFILDRILLK